MEGPVTRTELLDVVCQAFYGDPKPNKERLLAAARESGAREAVLRLLDVLPSGRRFHGPRELWEEMPDVPVGATT